MEIQKEVLPSPFSYQEGKELYIQQNRVTKDATMTFRGNNTAILQILAKYRVLNRFNLERELRLHLPPKLHKPDYVKELHELEAAGFVMRYAYETDLTSGRDNLVLYALSKKGCDYAKKKGYLLRYESAKEGERITTTAALEFMSLNQWHIGIREGYKNSIVKEYYQDVRFLNDNSGITLPSVFELKSKHLTLSSHTTLVTMAYTKKKENIGVLLNILLGVNTFVKERSLPWPVYIILVDGYDAMQEAYCEIYRYEMLKWIDLYFSLDMHTTKKNQLERVYRCSMDEKNIVRYETVALWEERHGTE